jgi:uncharacterized membrane protein YidH (DUF202 family)
MRNFGQILKAGGMATALVVLSGCSHAPSIDIDGSFLPSWMLCLLVGMLVTGVVHWQLVQRKMQHHVMPAVVFYPSLVIAIASLVWLLFFC